MPVEAVKRQAEELAEHLQGRLQDLDRREAELNARAAELESELRAARIWLAERGEEAERLRQELDASDKAAAERDAAASFAAEAEPDSAERNDQKWRLEEQRRRLAEKEEQLDRRQAELDRREQEHSIRISGTRDAPPSETAASSGDGKISELQNLLAENMRQLEEDRRSQQAAAEKMRQELEVRLSRAAERQRSAEAELQERERLLSSRTAKLQKRAEALDRLYGEVNRLHRETLEFRLAAEQLWARLAGHVSPAELTQSLAQVRRDLADQFRLEAVELDRRREDLQGLAGLLEDRQRQLEDRRAEFTEWAARRNEETEQQAARLVAREQELDREEQRLRRRQESWSDERRALQAEIARLTSAASLHGT